jgi:hypothetical protein
MVMNGVAGVSIPVTRDVFEKLLSTPFSDDTNIFRCVGISKDSIVIGPCCLLGNSTYVKSSDVLKSSKIKELETDDDIVVEELSVANFLRSVSLKKNSAVYVLKDRRQNAVGNTAINCFFV